MESVPQQRGSQPSQAAFDDDQSTSHGAASPEEGDRSPITHDTGSDTVLISATPHSLSHTSEPALSPPTPDSEYVPSEQTSPQAAPAAHPSPAPPSLTRQSTSNEPKKCWICFGDSTEDGPDTSPWRTPCPCALTAHEACLLDWIADLEAPPTSTAQSSRRRGNRIQCPQCKTEIRIARPWSPVVAGVRAIERVTGTLVLPGVAGVLFGGMFSACFVHGAMSVFMILGPEDWAHLIGAAPDGRPTAVGFRLTLGLPMVPVILVLSRTKLADGILPMLPFIFFAPQLGARSQWHAFLDSRSGMERFGTGYETAQLWPPSAAAAFASLPYIRAIYNAAYAKLFAAKSREWLKAVQREPRPGEDEGQDEGALNQPAHDHGDLELEINAEIQIMDDEEPEVVQQAIDDAVQAAEQREANQHQNGAAQPQAGRPAQGRGGQAAQHNQGLILSASKIADTVLGALCFPAVASLMGEALKLGLPATWTAGSVTRRPGLLQSKWGRSIVGGCLFVVMKDALVLYSRYRLAQDHQKRRVEDYKGPSPRSRGRAS